jgi:hypothetical protein
LAAVFSSAVWVRDKFALPQSKAASPPRPAKSSLALKYVA